MALESAAKTDTGKVRTNNEDSFAADEARGLFIVADGMGGHNAGEVASRMACDLIGRNLADALERQMDPDKTQVMFGEKVPGISATANRIVSSIRLANQVVFEASRNSQENHGMGTTVVAALIQDNRYHIAWVGDSRAYLVRHGSIQQLTTDHSLVQEQINQGLISSEDAEKSQFKNVLTRALGTQPSVEVDSVETPVFDDDYLLLCSDGLTRMVSDQEILASVQGRKAPSVICDELIALANAAGGRDNITAVVVRAGITGAWDRMLKALQSL